MRDFSFIAGQQIAVIGYGRTGRASAQFLRAHSADIAVWDDDIDLRGAAAQDGFPVFDPQEMTPAFVLWSPGIPHYGPKAHCLSETLKQKNIAIISDIEIFVRAVTNDILAITGTNGKSTTTALIAHVLGKFRPVAAGGNLGEAALALPELPSDGVYVLELSSYQLELTPGLKPKGAILLNITPDHLDRHGDIEGYIAAKEKIFASLSEDADRVAVIGIDTAPSKASFEKLRAALRNATPVSTLDAVADGVFVDGDQLFDRGEHLFDLSKIPVLRGRHNFENAACAYALINRCYGYSAADIFAAMMDFPGLAHRQHLVATINGVSYINDSKATNAEAVAKALACTNNAYWILGGQAKAGGLSGLESDMGRIRHAFLIGEAEDSFAIWLKACDVPMTRCGTLENAVSAAHDMAQRDRGQPGGSGTVLLSPACASWDQFRSFEHRGDVFTALVRELAETSR